MSDNRHVRCGRSMVVWGRMYGNMDMGGEPRSLLAVYNNTTTRTTVGGLVSVKFLRALGSQSDVNVWQHTLVG